MAEVGWGIQWDYRELPKAVFYPALGKPVKLEIEGDMKHNNHRRKRQFMATHDLFALSNETRHFIDEYLWNQLKDDNPLLKELVRPYPPTQYLCGTRAEEPGLSILGMLLNEPTIRFVDSPGEVKLEFVLVVKNLPVPFHINTKTDIAIARKVGSVSGELTKDWFPRRYHDHPYWNEDLRRTTIIAPLACDPRFEKLEANMKAVTDSNQGDETDNDSEDDCEDYSDSTCLLELWSNYTSSLNKVVDSEDDSESSLPHLVPLEDEKEQKDALKNLMQRMAKVEAKLEALSKPEENRPRAGRGKKRDVMVTLCWKHNQFLGNAWECASPDTCKMKDWIKKE